jgi:SCY1-like protein 2
MRSLPVVLPVLDFSTIKNELFPVIAAVFTRTNSLAIKVRGLQAFVILCGGSTDAAADDGLNGLAAQNKSTSSSSSALDKYTMQEKIVPLIKGIKTKEPAVMMAALNVMRIVGQTADADFVAMDLLPILWSMSLGPLLELKQFQTFMDLIKTLSRRVEDEQTRKLQELSGSNGTVGAASEDFMAFGGVTGTTFDTSNGATEDDFESLVKGRGGGPGAGSSGNNGFASWDDAPVPRASSSSALGATASVSRSSTSTPNAPAFSWSTPPPQPTSPPSHAGAVKSQQASFRTVTPDLGRFESLTPSSTQFSQPMQPTQQVRQPATSSSSSVNWSTASSAASSNPWATPSTPNYTSNNSSFSQTTNSAFGGMTSPTAAQSSRPAFTSAGSSFSLPPPPGSTSSGFSIAPPPAFGQQQQQQKPQVNWGAQSSMGNSSAGGMMAQKPGPTSMNSMMSSSMMQPQQQQQQQQQQPQQKSGLDQYQSLI